MKEHGAAPCIIEVKDVVKEYSTSNVVTRALSGVSLAVYEGEFLTITGPSGSGKSTLLNLLSMLDVPTSGSVKVNGISASGLSDKELARIRNLDIGIVFQNQNLIPTLSVIENVGLPLVYQKVRTSTRRARAEKLLGLMGLSGRTEHLPTQLSGGQQQRVGIARALITEPSIVVADEPTGNLDSSAAKEVLEIFLEISKKGTAVVMVTHDRDLAKLGDRVISVLDGHIVESSNE